MQFLSFRADKQARFGAVIENRIVDLGRRMSGHETLRDVIAAGALVRARDIAAESSADFEMKEIEFLPPIPNPGKIVCVGRNHPTAGHTGGNRIEHPELYFRAVESLVGHDQALLCPLESDQFDSQGVLALVVGSGGRRIPRDKAHNHLAGLTLANDTTLVDWARHSPRSVTAGKNFQNSAAIGPCLVTIDQFEDLSAIQLSVRVNEGETLELTTQDMLFPVDYLVSYLSTFMPLNPGDIILTGTLGGAGVDADPPRYLRDGDRVDISAAGIGTLRNVVVAESVQEDDAAD